jgi:uncharacterized membrane protein
MKPDEQMLTDVSLQPSAKSRPFHSSHAAFSSGTFKSWQRNSHGARLLMVPFIVLTTLFVVLSIAGHFQLPVHYGWWTSLRLSLSGMFLLTASAHWGKRRPDLIKMLPPFFTRPDVLVTVTGILEILGAVGLMIPAVARYAALGLALLLIAVFPANIHAARKRLTIGGRQVQGLAPRTVLQCAFLAAAVAVFLGGPAI